MTSPTEISVLSSIATREAYRELVPQFERASGHKVATTWAGTVDIMKRMAAGERYDLIVISSEALDELVRQGKVVPGSRTDLATCGIGVAVRSGARKPDIGSGEALKRALLAARTVGHSSGPSGVYLGALFERMGIAAELKAKHRSVPSGMTVGTIVASGEAEIGFQQISELVHIDGIDLVGPLPPEVQCITVFCCGIHAAAAHPDQARALARFLSAPETQAIYRKNGLQPASQL
jgi:molybdate transport system substrate-binding protein